MHRKTWNLTLKRMDAIIKEVMAANNLTSIGVNMFPTDKLTPFTVYVHWGNNCTSGNGATISDAISVALQSMRDQQERADDAETLNEIAESNEAATDEVFNTWSEEDA